MALSADPPPPPADLRRAVTGHDDCGTACVRSDDLLPSSVNYIFALICGVEFDIYSRVRRSRRRSLASGETIFG